MRGSATEPDRPVRAAEVGELEVFATGRTVLIAPGAAHAHDAVEVADLTVHLHRAGLAIRGGLEHARAVRAVPGPRPGHSGTPIPATGSWRRGNGCDIVRPLHLDPIRASAAAISGRWLGHPIEHVEVLDDSTADGLVWKIAIIGDRRTRRTTATLHLLASPSMVVTIIELIPHGRHRWDRREVVRDGVAAADILAGELIGAAGR